jgi:uncharacterized protein
VAAIRSEALRLWLRGVRLVARADAATANCNGDLNSDLASGESHAYIDPALTAREGTLWSSEDG